MEARQRRALRRLRGELAEQLRLEVPLQYLYQEGVVNRSLLEELEAEPVAARRNLKLLDYLPGRGPRAFAAFVHSLRDEAPWLSRRLEEEEAREDEDDEPPADDVLSTISDHVLNGVPTDKQLNHLSGKMGTEWEQVVMDLGLRSSDVYRCKMNHQYNVQAQILASFIVWKQRLGKQATVRNLCTSLTSADVDPTVIKDAFQ
ncbi:death domain-containing protein CRADD-like [Amblyraja radiata]|uniref:death domain-containing protein CRADD-like n=1 Tax=Amblyraja radiata TaxID=386614 RepID=UPI001402FA04|nr:death domain-containing protein CRADD-like [Amblyraja radiata]